MPSSTDRSPAARGRLPLKAVAVRRARGAALAHALARIGMFLDELPNTPLPKILQYFAEARGLGVSICAAAQSGSQLDVV